MLLLLQSLNETAANGSYIGATRDVLLYMLIATLLATLFWYFWQKKDKAKIEKLQNSIEKLQPKYNILNNEHAHLKAEHGKLKVGLSDLIDNYQELENKHQSIVNTQSSAKNLYEQVDEERQSLLDSYESMETNFNSLEIKYNDAVTTLDRLEEEIENTKEDGAELNEINKHLRSEIKKLEVIAKKAGYNLAKIKEDYQIGSSPEEDEIEKLIGAGKIQIPTTPSEEKIAITSDKQREEKEKLQAVYDALKEDYNQIRNEHTKLNNHFKDLQGTHNQLLAEENSNTLAKNTETKTAENVAIINNKVEYEALKNKYEELKEEHDNTILPQLRASQQLLNQKEENYRQLESKLEEQHLHFQSSSNQVQNFEGLKATNQALYNNNKVLNDRHLELQKKYESLSKEYSGLKSQFQLLRERYGQVEKELDFRAVNNSEFEQLSKEYSNLKIEFLAAADRHKKRKGQLDEKDRLLKAIKESSNYGIIYLPSNLQIIEGIGPKIEQVLNKADIHTWEEVAKARIKSLKNILKEGGKQFHTHNPETWSQQATLLVQGRWKSFRDLEAKLIGGKRVKNQDSDDLKKMEGIGPKIEVLLNNANIYTWKKLSKTGIGELKRILKTGGSSYQVHNPSSWPEQAALAVIRNWAALEKLQEKLKSGRLRA